MSFGKFKVALLPPQRPAPDTPAALPSNRCSVTSCLYVCVESGPGIRGLCKRHYDRAWREKTRVSTEASETCTMTCCERPVYYKAKSRHLCRPHYKQMHSLRERRHLLHELATDFTSDSSCTSSISSTIGDDSMSSAPTTADELTSDLPDDAVCFTPGYMNRASTGSLHSFAS